MTVFIDIMAVLCGLVGFVGCILPVIPGPPLTWAGMLLLYIKDNGQISTTALLVMLAVTVIVTVLDYIVPAYFTRVTGGSKAAGRGSLAGMVLGIIFFPPWGMIVGAFAGALLAEMFIEGKQLQKSVKPAFGSLLGFLFGTGFKMMACGVMLFYIFRGL